MKKFYSLVLMTAALLIGTNAWAKDFSGNAAQLQKAIADIIYGAVSDPEIKLQNDVELNGTIWVGTEKLSDPYKSITLDLNGHSITYNSADPKNNRTLIALTHGELKIINTAANEATLGLTGNAADGATIVSVYGSYRSSRWNEAGTELTGEGTNTRVEGWCSHLEIGSNVKLYAEQGCQGTGLYIGTGTLKYPKADGTLANTAYPVSVMNTSGWGFAHGVRVDFYGKIDFQGTNEGKGYGIKANGTMRSPLSCANDTKEGFNTNYTTSTKTTTYIPYLANYYNNNADINKNATLATDATHKRDTVDAPFIWIHPGAEVIVRDAGSKVTALYAAGYAKWLVQGYAAGKTGMYVSSGVMDLNDAYVKSTAAGWESSTSAGSANGGGSGVVINSRDSYAGGVEFAVTGDTHIESIKGYAIEEIVNTTAEPNPDYDPTDPSSPETIQVTKVADITIEGGTITGGAEGAIVVSTATLDEAAKNEDVEVVIYGGNVIGDSYAGDKGAVTTGDLNDLMPKTGDYHTTEVTDENGNTIIVVSKGGDPDAGDPITGNMVSNQLTDASVKWTINTKDTIKTDLKLAELEINTTGLAQELVIKENATLEVGRVVLGKDAKIIVEAGGKFIVTGDQGIVAPVVDNIILRTSETAQATFLFKPSVNSNRHPNATVEMISKAYRKANGQYVFQRFGVPSYTNEVTRADVQYTVPTAIYRYDYAEDSWKSMANTDKFVPFQCYELTTQQATAGEVYTFKCPLVGNVNAELNLQAKWNYYSNSYTAPINIKQMINRFKNDNADVIYPTVYLYDAESNWWVALNNANYLLPSSTSPKEIAPMQAFIFMRTGTGLNPAINYAEQVWTPIADPTHVTYAPARNRQEVGTAVIEIADADGKQDKVTLIEGEQFSADIDLSYDAEKYMNPSSFNLFANDTESPMEIVATDDLNGTMLSMSSKSQTSFTMTFTNVSNMNYAVRDMLTGTVTEIVEGATYMFSVPADATVEGRFQIVEKANAPTAIDNIEETAAIKGIYTITGQFVGNDYYSLPNGVYVIDGKKIVK